MPILLPQGALDQAVRDDLFACFVLFDGIITFVSAKISGIAAYPVFFSIE